MKWDGDPYKDLKWQIFEIIRNELREEDALRITVKQIINGIDKMVTQLTKCD
jgi:hypothetical protein